MWSKEPYRHPTL